METDRVAVVEANLDRAIAETAPPDRALAPDDPLRVGTGLTAARAVELFADMVRSRALDVVARELRARGEGYYTIASAGHEHNGVLGAQLALTDPCFLHYRSGAFMSARASRAGRDVTDDVVASLAATADDPVAQGRHKVWGSADLWVPPQTSTIASHIPKAVGTAFALDRARETGVAVDPPSDAIVCCSFGDASANHATALAGMNAARWSHRRGAPVPVLFVCEDNGWGISVDTPRRWIARTFGAQPHLRYIHAGDDLATVWDRVSEAIALCRRRRGPVFLHLPTVRLWGHAGSDIETGYRSVDEIARDEARDPLAAAARMLVSSGAATPDDLAGRVAAIRGRVRAAADGVTGRTRLRRRDEVVAPLAPYDERATRHDAEAGGDPEARAMHFDRGLPEHATAPTRRTLAAHVNSALHDELLRRPEALVFGEDVARKGGVYHLTAGLQQAFGRARVFDTLLDETTILGVAQGAGLLGMLPIPEIQYLAYLHNALDQLRGEAASLSFFSAGQFRNPMVVRVAGFGYQRGFGGHFHNDNAVGALREIPGLIVGAPSRGGDAAMMLRGATALARVNGRVVCLIEPIALYHERDLYEPGDGLWLSDYPAPGEALLPGEVGVHHPGHRDLLIVTYANGVRMSLQAARRLRSERGVRARVLDVRWLSPLPLEAIRRHADDCGRVLVADECRATGGGIADAVIAALAEGGFDGAVGSVRSADSFVPLGPAADAVLLSTDDIAIAAAALTVPAGTR
jgi:2-oxoisovalerate dehydrogenase E1 component